MNYYYVRLTFLDGSICDLRLRNINFYPDGTFYFSDNGFNLFRSDLNNFIKLDFINKYSFDASPSYKFIKIKDLINFYKVNFVEVLD